MTTKILLTFILFHTICSAQMDNGIDKGYFRNGKMKFIAITRGVDTIEFKRYYKNGQIKDSVWLYIPDRQEIPIGTEKKYYKNGNISSITYYKKGNAHYSFFSYYPDGKLKVVQEFPTGKSMSYNNKGQQVAEADIHMGKHIYVSKKFRKSRHLKNTNYKDRIAFKRAILTQDQRKITLQPGILISLTCKMDTNMLTHCLIEGFSKDSIYLSKFHYNEDYFKGSGLDILKYDSTFALGINQMQTMYYTKHNNGKRHNGALTSQIAGIELVLFPFIPFAIIPITGTSIATAVALYAGFSLPGVGLYYYGKYLFRTTVPKKYDMSACKIFVKT